MTNNETPRIRSLLRQADRNAEAGKLAAADELYRQIIEEAPQSAPAWLGLSLVTRSENERQEAYAKALALDPHIADENEAAAVYADAPSAKPDAVDSTNAATSLTGTKAAPVAPAVPEIEPAAGPLVTLHEQQYEIIDAGTELFCYRHPSRSTSLRCYKCSKPICSDCTVKTPVGYLCPDCYREAEDAFFNARPADYLLALLVALPLSLIAGYLVMRFSASLGFFFYIIMFFVGGAVGGFIGRMTKRAIGGRRGRYIPHLVAGCVIAGVLIWALPLLLLGAGALFALIGPGIYLATAVSSAYYWAR